VTVAVFVTVAFDFQYAISAALLGGFALFSVSNYVMFRFRYPRVHLLTAHQLIGLTLPAACFVGAVVTRPAWASVCVAVYFIVHAWVIRQTGMIDFVSLAKRCIGVALRSRPAT
jgi:hypothetical protein